VRLYVKASRAESTNGGGMHRGLFGLIWLCVLGLVAFLGISAPSAGAACSNEAFRSGPSAHLPACRAYELVSPPEKEGYEVDHELLNVAAPAPIASPSGNTLLWSVERGGFGESLPSNGPSTDYLSRRGVNWSSEALNPPLAPSGSAFLTAAFIPGLTEDLNTTVSTGGVEPPLTPEAPEGSKPLYVRDNASGSYRLLSIGLASGLGETELGLGGISADGSHVVFNSEFELTGCGGPSNEALCDWNAATGALSLVGVLPGGGVSAGAVSIAGLDWRRPVSTDGSRVFFHEAGGECGVCVRINGATTQLVSETGSFQFASSDGSVAYVTDGGDLERWDGALTNLTGGGGEVKGVLGTSSDGTRVYFVAGKELAPGAAPGENNLYLWTAGSGFKFIAKPVTLTSNWSTSETSRSSRVAPDGMHLAFTANNSLTGFPDNGKSQAYLYSVATGALVCASCVVAEPANGADIVGGTGGISVNHLSRNLSDGGDHLFFTSKEALVSQDSNGVDDVYEYDPVSGAVGLISTGTDPLTAYFGDASAAGTDALFTTRERLVPLDTDTAIDAYDARVSGGLASQHPAPPSPPCTGVGCRGESSSPSFGPAASAVVAGRGNISQKKNCNKLGREAKKLSQRAKRLRRNARQAQRTGKSAVARKRKKKANRLAKRAKNKSNSAKNCRKANRRASK